MRHLKVVKINRRMKMKPKVLRGGDVLNWCIPTKVSVNGNNGGAIRIPQKFLKKLAWEPGKTEVEVAITTEGNKLVIEKIEETQKAAS